MLAAGLLLSLLCAETRAQGDYSYTTNNGAITVTAYRGPGGAVTIPDTLGGLPVTGIGTYAFANRSTLTGVTVSEGVRNIASGAFAGCYNLASLTLPGGLTNIGSSAFMSCRSLLDVTIPASVRSIGDWAFEGCTGMTNASLAAGLARIGSAAFKGCDGLSNIVLPASVLDLGYAPFADCARLEAITADEDNPAYSSVGGVLFGKTRAEIVQYPGGRKGDYAVPEGVTDIRHGAFSGCSGLTAAGLPRSLTLIGSPAFSACTNLASITVDALNDSYRSADGVLFDKSGACLLRCPGGRPGAYTVPEGVTAIGEWAFADCVNLDRVTLASSVNDIAMAAFANCARLTRVDLPNGLASIADSTFSSCTSLASISIPGSVTELGDFAFEGCTGLTNIALPTSLTTIGVVTFGGCARLAHIALPAGLTAIGSAAFSECRSLEEIAIPSNVTSLGDHAFQGCTSLTRVDIPASLARIEDGTFVWCTSLDSVTVPEGVTSIGALAFFYCESLRQVTLPATLMSLEDEAFSDCYNLSAVRCLGNAPHAGADVFLGAPEATVYYRSGTTGWGPTFAGRPTALWEPLPPGPAWRKTFPIATNAAVVNVGGFGACSGTNFLAAYVSGQDYCAQLLAPDGARLGPPLLVGSNPSFTPGVAASYGDGHYLVLWSDGSVASGVSIFGQRITTDGRKAGAAFPLLESAGSHGLQQVCAAASDGSQSLVVWQDDANGFLYGQWVSGSGALSGAEFAISDQPNNGHSAAAAFGATNCLVVWQSDGGSQLADEWTYGRLVSRDGASSSPFRISVTPSIDQNPLAVAFDGTNYFVVWNQDSELTPSGGALWNLYGRLVSPTGTPAGDERLLSADQPLFPALAFDGENYLLGWSVGAAGGSDHTVRLRFFDRNATPRGPEFTPFQAQGSRQPLLLGIVAGPNQLALSTTLCDLLLDPDGNFAGFASGVVYGAFLPKSTTAPRLTVATPQGAGQCPLRLEGTPGINYAIEFTPQLALPHWSALVTNSPLDGTFEFTDRQATNTARSYRALAVP